MTKVTEALNFHREQGTYRSLQRTPIGIDFSSNDYLGLSRCPQIRARLIQALELGCPLGATGSRLISGQTVYHEQVEQFLSHHFGLPSCLLFSSGTLANQGVLSVLGGLGAHFFSDEFNHASLVDGIRLSKSTKSIFRHRDLNQLEKLLRKSSASLKVIVTESVFSMDGDDAPLAELMHLADHFGSWLVVDEAHATGIFGQRGLGRMENLEKKPKNLIAIHSGGKALGGQGAFVLCSSLFRDFLINRARSFIYNTALSPLHALQIQYAIEEIFRVPQRGQRLLEMAGNWRKNLSSSWGVGSSQSQIVPVKLGSNERALDASAELAKRGFHIRAIRSPTVPIGTERLRITLKSDHRPEDLKRLSEALHECLT